MKLADLPTPETTIVELSIEDDPQLVRECEAQLGKFSPLPVRGKKRYTSSLVAKARAAIAVQRAGETADA